LGQLNYYPAAKDPDGRLRAAFAGFQFDSVPDIRLNLVARLLLFLTTLDGQYERAGMHHTPAQGLQSQLVTYVNEHLFENISLQSVADHFYRSRSQISRVFQQATGSPLWEYVTIKRLMAARAMIQRGEPSGAACIACGFSDYSSFFRIYRTHFGHPPKHDAPKS
jgi:transcriptional regulator GlxA family with amidase domain